MTNELVPWTPPPFEDGSDLLPVSLAAQEVDTTGRSQVRAEDLIMPVLVLLQGMSPEVMKEMHPDAKPGRFYFRTLDEVFQAPVRVLGLAHFRSRALFPDAKKGKRHVGLEKCIARDGEHGDKYGDCASCPHKEWGATKDEPPPCSEAHNFVVLTEYGPAIVRFARKSYNAGKQLLTTWTRTPKPLFAHPLELSAVRHDDKVDGQDRVYYTLAARWRVTVPVPPEVQALARETAKLVDQMQKQGGIRGDDEDREIDDDVQV